MSRNGLIVALLVSLAVNLFVIGGLGGMALMTLRGDRPPPPPQRPPMFARAEELSSELSPEHQQQWLATLRQAFEGAEPRMRQSHDLRRQAWQALQADPVDSSKVLADLSQSRDLELQARGDIDRAVVGFASGLPLDERRELADKLSRARLGGRMVFSGRRPGPPPGGGEPPPLPDR
jgi:uncharacterized membrane protein